MCWRAGTWNDAVRIVTHPRWWAPRIRQTGRASTVSGRSHVAGHSPSPNTHPLQRTSSHSTPSLRTLPPTARRFSWVRKNVRQLASHRPHRPNLGCHSRNTMQDTCMLQIEHLQDEVCTQDAVRTGPGSHALSQPASMRRAGELTMPWSVRCWPSRDCEWVAGFPLRVEAATPYDSLEAAAAKSTRTVTS